jgi:hypothetical protein
MGMSMLTLPWYLVDTLEFIRVKRAHSQRVHYCAQRGDAATGSRFGSS